MNLSQSLRIKSDSPTIAFVGAGGKTTALFQLAREFKQRVIVTATTHLGAWQTPLADHHIIAKSVDDLIKHDFQGVTLITGSIENDRTEPIDKLILLWLHDVSKEKSIPFLIEADGARQKSLKAPAEHEPEIPDFVEMAVVVVGLSGLGKPLNEEYVHRPEIFAKLARQETGAKITAENIVKLICDPKGGLKNIPPRARRVVLLNQADTPELKSASGKMARQLLDHYDSVIVGTLQPVGLQTIEPTAGIILAAGGSKRFGQTKQLLDWHGQPFVRAVAKTAQEAGLSPIVIVTGANADEVEKAVAGLDVIIAQNKDWEGGQSSSIRVGVKALPSNTGASIFLLADQPQIPVSVIRALMETHASGLYPIVAPLVLMEKRANPVLFDRVTFPDLLAIEGDVGGRAIFSKHKVEFIPWHDDILLLDVDKPEDYQRLMDDE